MCLLSPDAKFLRHNDLGNVKCPVSKLVKSVIQLPEKKNVLKNARALAKLKT